MRILAIDTTTLLGSIALVEDDRLIASVQQGTEMTYAERLLSGIDYMLTCAQWNRESLDLIAVAQGPGSFTGLRIGIATSKGLCVALNKPLKGASSLQVLALGAPNSSEIVVPVIDARRDEVYAAVYRYSLDRTLTREQEEFVCPPSALVDRLRNVEGQFTILGDGARRYREVIATGLGSRAHFPGDAFNFPHAYHLASVAREKFMREGGDDMVALVPNYIRHSDAEIGFQGRK